MNETPQDYPGPQAGLSPADPYAQSPYTADSGFRDPAARLAFAQIAVVIGMVTAGASLLTDVWEYVAAGKVIDENPAVADIDLANALPVSQQAMDGYNTALVASGGAAILWFVVTIVGAVAVIRWQSVAVRNLVPLGLEQPRFSAAKAGWCWIVPIWNLFGPKQAFNDLWRSGEPGAPAREGREAWIRRSIPDLMGGWWACWIGAGVINRIASRLGSDTLAGVQTAAIFWALSAVATIAAGVFFLRVLTQITQRQHARARELQLN